jgi:hypothetical protein
LEQHKSSIGAIYGMVVRTSSGKPDLKSATAEEVLLFRHLS